MKKPIKPEYPERKISDVDRLRIENELSHVDFGDYVTIEHHCYGAPNEHMTNKVIGTLVSNTWVDVPVWGWENHEVSHDHLVQVVSCIQSGVKETQVKRYRLCDVEVSDGSWNKHKDTRTAVA